MSCTKVRRQPSSVARVSGEAKPRRGGAFDKSRSSILRKKTALCNSSDPFPSLAVAFDHQTPHTTPHYTSNLNNQTPSFSCHSSTFFLFSTHTHTHTHTRCLRSRQPSTCCPQESLPVRLQDSSPLCATRLPAPLLRPQPGSSPHVMLLFRPAQAPALLPHSPSLEAFRAPPCPSVLSLRMMSRSTSPP